MNDTSKRQPAGVPVGGQFASHDRAEALDLLIEQSTPRPGSVRGVNRSPMSPVAKHDTRNSPAFEFCDPARRGELELRARHPEWDDLAQSLFIQSLLDGRYVGTLVIARRKLPEHGQPYTVVVDGSRRVAAMQRFVDGELDVPGASADDLRRWATIPAVYIDVDGRAEEVQAWMDTHALGAAAAEHELRDAYESTLGNF